MVGRRVPVSLRQLLKLLAECIIHPKPPGDFVGDIAESGSSRIEIDLLKNQNVGSLRFEELYDFLQPQPAFDVPVDHTNSVRRPEIPPWKREAARKSVVHSRS